MNGSYQFTIITNNYQESKQEALILKEYLKKIKAQENDLNPDIVFIIGGDGTFLKAVNKYNQKLDQVKFINFKQGKIGFYHNFSVTEINKVVQALAASSKQLVINEFDLLEVSCDNKIFYAVNEMRLVNFIQTLTCEVYINEQLLQIFSGSGIIVSTKTGSTGLMKTTGGAIILAKPKLMEYQELFPINNNIYRSLRAPIILDQNQVITLKLKEHSREKLHHSQLVVDTFIFCDKLIKEVKIKISNQTLKVFSFQDETINDDNFLLIKKLHNSFIQF